MLSRLFLILALMLSALPAGAAAAPSCHDDAKATMAMAMAMAMADHAMPMAGAEAPVPRDPPAHGERMCIGCIAPATLIAPHVAPPHALAGRRGVPPLHDAIARRNPTVEPPPPRG
ncbi:hypothetical protein [Sphingomonas sp.]|uniref:hypothetical protein n=1 Tax=Sphingomonas sp. TaxID=28214 RepID=UPI001ECAC75D|nr:hypothetical protein [Sphingomonas sp.]MBX3594117.1 hypothetical protein [Sphingomonas sp.]